MTISNLIAKPIVSSNTDQTTMKAVICPQYGPPEVLQLTTVGKPIPKDNEILVKIHASSVTVADTRIRAFRVPAAFWLPARFVLGLTKPRAAILGVELSGVVEAVGKDVNNFKKGDYIVASALEECGAYAEYKCLPESGIVAIKPDRVSFEEAAVLPIGGRTALHFFRRGNLRAGQKVLIYGASGSVGTYAAQLAKYFEADVTAICSSKNIDMMKSIGVNKIVDYTKRNFTEELEMYDMIFVAIDEFPFSLCNRFLKDGGVYINITSPFKSPRMIWASIRHNKKMYLGEGPKRTPEDLNLLINLMDKKIIKAVIDRTYTLDEIVEAHRYVDKGHKKGNVVIKVK